VESEHVSKTRRTAVEESDEHKKMDWLYSVREHVVTSMSVQSPLTINPFLMFDITSDTLQKNLVASSWETYYCNPSPFARHIVLNSQEFANSDRVVMKEYVPPSTDERRVQTRRGKRRNRTSDEEESEDEEEEGGGEEGEEEARGEDEEEEEEDKASDGFEDVDTFKPPTSDGFEDVDMFGNRV